MSVRGGRAGVKRCKKCKKEKDDNEFFPERKGYKVRYCNECAARNMKRYWEGRQVGKKAPGQQVG